MTDGIIQPARPRPRETRARVVEGMRRFKARAGLAGALLIGLASARVDSLAAGATNAVPTQDWVVRTWTTEQGLPNNSVNAIAQTPDGYIWLGTANGVARFDGVRFKSFGLKDGLGSILVSALFVDRRGALWVGTYGGLSRWEDDRFRTWTTQDGLANDNVQGMVEDVEGTLWIRSWTGLSRWQQGQLTTYSAQEGWVDRRVQAMTCDGLGRLWAGTFADGLFEFRAGKFILVAGPPEVPATSVNGLLADRKGGLWVGVRGKVLRRRGEQWTIYGPEQGWSNGDWSHMLESADGTVWATGAQGRPCYFSQDRFVALTNRNLLPGGVMTALADDREGNLWVGRLAGGLHRFTRAQVATYGAGGNYSVLSAAESADGLLWAGTSGYGLYRVMGGRFEPVDWGNTAKRYSHYYSILPTRDGDLWLGVNGALLLAKAGRSASLFGPDQLKAGEEVRVLAEDGVGGVWVGTVLGRVLRAYQGQLTPTTDRLSGKRVTALLPAPEGGVWIGTSGGLFRLNGGVLSALTRTNGLLSDHVRGLYSSHDGALWIGTAGGGLSRWAGGRLASFTTEQGLPDNIIPQIIQDAAGDYWFGSSRGIFRVRQAELNELAAGKIHFVHPLLLGRAEGMFLEECTGGPPCLQAGSGLLCFPTLDGLAVVDPKEFNTPAARPRVVIEESLVDDQPAPRPADPSSQPLVVHPGRHQMTFHYTALGASVPERIRFKCRLEGLEDWVEAGTERVAHYRSVPPGHYVFQVVACDHQGLWNEAAASLAIFVQPHVWQTRWFQLLGGLAAATAAFLAYRRRIAGLEKKQGTQDAFTRQLITTQEQERSRLARELHDDITQRLARLAIDVGRFELGHAETSPAETARELREGLVQLSEDVHALSYRLHPSILEDLGLAEALRAEAERFTRKEAIAAEVKLHELPGQIPNGAALGLLRVAQEALRNVARHAKARRVEVSLRGLDGGLQMGVQDDGVGFDPNQRRRRPSLGLTSMRERVHLLGGELNLESAPGHGTTVVAWVPLEKAKG